MGSDRLVSRTGAGVFVVGVGLLVAGPGVAVAVASPSDSGDSSSSSSDRPSRDSDRTTTNRDRDRSSSSSSSRDSGSGPARDRSSEPSGSSDDDPADAPSQGAEDNDDDSAVEQRSRTSGSNGGRQSEADEVDPAVANAPEADADVTTDLVDPPVTAATPEVTSLAVEVKVDPAPVTRVPSLNRAAAGVDRERMLTLRTVTVQPRVVPVGPSSPVVPEAIGYVGSLTLTRRDLELQQTYGNPEYAARFWQAQHSGDCVLISVADVIGILTGKAPTEAQIVYQAMNLASVNQYSYAGKMMYRGMRDSGKGAYYEDAVELLGRYGITAQQHHFGNYGSHNTYYEPEALEKLKTALSDPNQAVIAAINAHVLWSQAQPGYRGDIPPASANANHAVVVTGYDPVADTITINDHAQSQLVNGKPLGQAWVLPRAVFMSAWNRSNYQTVISVRPTTPVIPTSTWKNLQPRRDSVKLASSIDAKDTQHRTR